MKNKHTDTVIMPALRELFESSWKKCRILYFSAPCGFGKTTVANALLETRNVCRFDAEEQIFWEEPLPDDCDTVLVDTLQAVCESGSQQAICDWINKNSDKHFVLLSRGVLPGWLLPYQFTGLLLHIEAKDLLFDRAATAALLALSGIEPSADELSSIQRDSIGYPVAVAMLCRHMAGGVHYSKELADTVRRELFFYFEEAVYRRFEPDLRRLLVSLAPFTSFDMDFAKMVSGDSQVGDLLSRLLRETTMLQYDSVDTYHFWPIFRQFLLWELGQDYSVPEQKDIYRRAGLYYELHDDYAHAMDCYIKSGDHGKTGELLIKNAQLHPGVAHYYEMEPYYEALPPEEILRSPVLMCGMSMLTSLTLDYEVSEQWYQELQDYTARLSKTDANYRTAQSRLYYLDIALPQRGSKGMTELIRTVFRAMMDKNLNIPAFSVTSCLPSVMNGGKDFCGWSKKDDLMYATLKLPLETVMGRDGVGLADCAICESKFEKGEDISNRLLSLVSRMGEIQNKGTPDISFAVMGLLARTQIKQGRAGAALEALENMRSELIRTGQSRFLPNLDAMRCRIWLRLGMREEYGRWLREEAPSSLPHFRALWRYRYLTKAMVQIADGAEDDALLSIAPLLPYCEQCARTMDSLYLRLLMAIAHYRKKEKLWEEELNTALDTALEYHFITPVAQHGAAILPLLKESGWQKDPPFFEKLLAATREQAVNYPDFLRPIVQMTEPLTPAELQVLKLLCANLSNQEICDMLGVKLPTVKTQVRSILQKLKIQRRNEAKDAAVRLHLLE